MARKCKNKKNKENNTHKFTLVFLAILLIALVFCHQFSISATTLEKFTPSRIENNDPVENEFIIPRKISVDEINQQQKIRKLHLKNKCQDKNLNQHQLNTDEFLMNLIKANLTDEFRMIKDDIHKWYLCEAPKIATTNWKRIFLQMSYPDKYQIFSKIERPHNQLHGEDGYRYLFEEKDDNTILSKFNEYEKVIFVRHPLDRLLSAFRDKILPTVFENPLYSSLIKTLKRGNRKAEFQKIAIGAFHEFLEYLILRQRIRSGEFSGYKIESFGIQQATGAKTRHWSSVYELCNVCAVDWSVIGKMESLEDDFQYLKAVTQNDAYELPKEMSITESEKQNRLERLKTYYGGIPKSTIRNVYEIYKDDFEMFDYKIPSFLQ